MTKEQERIQQRETDAQWAKDIPRSAREHMKHKPYQKQKRVVHKAVLVVDMPESCTECALLDLEMSTSCILGRRYKGQRPRMCPLATLPKRDYGNYQDEYQDGYAKGWNDCIDAITKSNTAAGKTGGDASGDDTPKAKTIPGAKKGDCRT